MSIYDEIGKILKKARNNAGLSQAKLGRRIGVTGPAISLIETGQTKASIERIQEIGSMIGVDAELVVAASDDERMQLAIRIIRSIEYADPAVLAPLSAWVGMWEAARDERLKEANSR